MAGTSGPRGGSGGRCTAAWHVEKELPSGGSGCRCGGSDEEEKKEKKVFENVSVGWHSCVVILV